MRLEEVSTKLQELAETYTQKVRELQKAELAYNLRYWSLFVNSGMGTVGAKEAAANLTCQEEGLLEPLQILRADMKVLQYERECYLAIASNLRVIQVRQEGGGYHD